MHRNHKLISLSVFPLLLAPGVFGQSNGVIRIPDATALRLSLSEPISSATNEVDDPVRFEVTEDVKVGDFVAVTKGATAVGHVVEVEPKRRLGRAGKLNFSIDHVKAVDGTNVRLRASSLRKGDDKSGTVIVGTVLLSPLFLIMRGKDVNVAKGTSIVAYVDGDREIGGPKTRGPISGNGGSMPKATETTLPAPTPKSVELATVVVKSDPDGADVLVDGKFAGNAPSTMQLPPGDHMVLMEKHGFKGWQRSINLTPGGIVTLNAALEKLQSTLDKPQP
jgi:hypothetical protein